MFVCLCWWLFFGVGGGENKHDFCFLIQKKRLSFITGDLNKNNNVSRCRQDQTDFDLLV